MIYSCGGRSIIRAPPATMDEYKSTKTCLLGEERWPVSQRRRAWNLFLNGLLLGLIYIEIQGIHVKLINNCQAEMIK